MLKQFHQYQLGARGYWEKNYQDGFTNYSIYPIFQEVDIFWILQAWTHSLGNTILYWNVIFHLRAHIQKTSL